MLLMSWNVNGIRACIKKGFFNFLDEHTPDILCIQETKAHETQVGLETPGYHQYWNSAVKKGYSGTLILTKPVPLSESYGIGIERHDQEGRVLTLEYEHYYLVNVYTPNSQRELTRLDYRTTQWDQEFLRYIKHLEAIKPVIFCGDLNVAHKEIDLRNPKTNHTNAGFTDAERASFDQILEEGFIDAFREFTNEPGYYTWWSYMRQARLRNIGWRIDYFCISKSLRPFLKNAQIFPEVLGSDHCPISLEMKL
jgi:exodeoxyribonuclease-3